MPGPGGAAARVSVVVPVYNAGQFVRQCLESLLAQDLGEDELEVVVIDDGSTDNGPSIIDELAAGRSGWHVITQPNSGWPGGPRNRGIERSSGEFVFFLDADDWLEPGALRALRDYAVDHDVDVAVPRLTPIGGASGYAEFGGVRDPAGVRDAYTYLTPQKLVRRDLLDRHEIRFPEGKVRLEDAILITRVYLHAQRIALLGDRAYYNKRRSADKGNLTFQLTGIERYFESLRAIAGILRDECDDPELADDLLLMLYRKKALWRLRAAKLLTYRRRRRRQWVQHIGEFADEFVDPRLQQRLPLLPRLRSEFARRRDIPALLALAEIEQRGGLALTPLPDASVVWETPDGRKLDVTGVI